MSEVIQKQKEKKQTKRNTRVDLTPMVDLGFLLITFFVFTSAMAVPKAMSMITPNEDDSTSRDKICESCAITVLPGANNKVYYYEGSADKAVYKMTDYSSHGLRSILVNKKREVAAQGRDAVLIIKPGKLSSFKNLIDIIDESNITMYKRYYLDKLSIRDAEIIE